MTESATENVWLLHRNGQQSGPYSLDHLRMLVSSTQLAGDDLVWRPGMGEWIPASRHPILFPRHPSGSTAPPPLPPMPVYERTPPPDPGQNAGIRMLIPVGRSGWAIAAGYLGLLSVLGIFGPFAIICGIMALREMKRTPSLHGAGRAWFGIIMGALGCVLLLFGIVAAVK